MTSRKSTGEGRAFWGCVNYPGCKQTFSNTTPP
jgi:ssDNA-binding Zn-finger/Zn-ribbon topoisomerase 1